MLQEHNRHHLSASIIEINHDGISFVDDEKSSCHDDDGNNRRNKQIKFSRHRTCLMKEDIHTLVKIIMMDFSNSNNTSVHNQYGDDEHSDHVDQIRNLQLLLKKKFSLQQEGKKKWLLNRELKYENFFPIEFMNDKEFMLNHIKKYGNGLEFAPPKLTEDRELVLQAVQLRGYDLYYVLILEVIKKWY
ncbi:hypothetical protein FDP41_005363 [Naegleria fowleri]|uniref:DUF4116 domain-containing protein n=1 Tax=Naegleria fowleri TaxID=5763 RepID=A0A6A5BR04_NAEFO|nr:uncharacterized protein FDP41_005363 [Naegleria fowleri]KAF0975369.1 hypothetical protein FDP41_005363 [Naegleria fowleri]